MVYKSRAPHGAATVSEIKAKVQQTLEQVGLASVCVGYGQQASK